MINIADNPLTRGQIREAAPAAAVPAGAESPGARSDQPAYPAKSMVLDGGRYYTVDTKK